MSPVTYPALDPELDALLLDFPLLPRIAPEILVQLRAMPTPPLEAVLVGREVERREVTVPADNGSGIPMTVLMPVDRAPAAPCLYWMHGGGMILGDRFSQLDIPLEWLDTMGAVVVTVDYRLAPEYGGLTPVQDCYRGLHWIAEHADDLGIDPDRIVVAGTSAGGGLAAGLALMARDLGGPAIAAQVLSCPMLDHRNTTTSSRQYSGRPGSGLVRPTSSPGTPSWPTFPMRRSPPTSRPVELANLPASLPPTSTSVPPKFFRDEVVDYAAGIWAAGGHAELHVWAGGFHGFDALFPRARLSTAARRVRTAWLARTLAFSHEVG